MEPSEFRRFSERLVERARRDDRVIGLVALGSTADTERSPDVWSDHDVWFVTSNGFAAAVREEAELMPDHHRVVVRFAETEHGRSVLYDDGHLVEYAVFDLDELEIASANAVAVLYDGADIAARMGAIVDSTTRRVASQDPTGDDRFGAFCAQIVIGVTRVARGELLSGHSMIRCRAVGSLAELLGRHVATSAVLDRLDPHRRFELALPEAAAKIEAAVVRAPIDAARLLVDVAERELSGVVPAASPAAFGMLRGTIERAAVS